MTSQYQSESEMQITDKAEHKIFIDENNLNR
jgi:hypothetical protein